MDNEVPEESELERISIDRIKAKIQILDKSIDDHMKILNDLDYCFAHSDVHITMKREMSLKKCYEEMLEKGITDEKLIFNLGEILIGKVCGVCGADKGYSYDKITADYVEIYNFKGDRFKIFADGDKIKITKMY